MESLINKWIKETLDLVEEAKKNQNFLRIVQLKHLLKELRMLKDRVTIKDPNE